MLPTPAWRYFSWIGAAMAAIALASGIAHSLIALRSAQAAIERAHTERIALTTHRINSLLEGLHRELIEALAEIDAIPRAEGALRRRELFRLLRQDPAWARVVLVDSSGSIVAQFDRLRPDDVDPWPEAVVRPLEGSTPTSRSPILTTFFYKNLHPRAVFAARRAAVSGHSVFAEASLTALDTMLASLPLGSESTAYIVDRQGGVLAHSDAVDPRAASARMDRQQLAAHARHFGQGLILLRPTIDAMKRDFIVSSADLPMLAARIVIETDRDAAMFPLWRSVHAAAVIVGFSLLAALLLSLALARRIARPIQSIEAMMKRVGSGTIPPPLEPRDHKELARLAAALNSTALLVGQTQQLLEQRVEQRTAELASAKERAERADLSKTRLLQAASHDLRQPLHAVGILAALIQHRSPAGEMQSLALRLGAATQALEQFFAGLLDLSRLDAGQVAVVRQPVALQPLFDRLRERFDATSKVTERTRLRVARSRVAVTSDPALLERIIQNFVANALKHAADGPVLLGVRRQGERACIEVHDQGPGVEPELSERIFDEFYRGPYGRETSGLGLGLAIVRRFAALLGHEVGVRRSPAGGACFYVCAPLASDAMSDPPSAIGNSAHADLDGVFALVIDDDPGALDSTGSLLEACGSRVVTAHDATDAETALAGHLRLPDIIVSDFQFAGRQDGFEAVLALRDRLCGEIPIVLLSADGAALGHAACAACIAKPANAAELTETIARLAKSRSPAASLDDAAGARDRC